MVSTEQVLDEATLDGYVLVSICFLPRNPYMMHKREEKIVLY